MRGRVLLSAKSSLRISGFNKDKHKILVGVVPICLVYRYPIVMWAVIENHIYLHGGSVVVYHAQTQMGSFEIVLGISR